jgi:nitroimidazol reductase NimA-like FMN-containing flavoprotein (pyridoxamine 5'-phosphate oxidase superfamily)
MSADEVEALLERKRICRIAFKGEEFPYLAPFQYYRRARWARYMNHTTSIDAAFLLGSFQ